MLGRNWLRKTPRQRIKTQLGVMTWKRWCGSFRVTSLPLIWCSAWSSIASRVPRFPPEWYTNTYWRPMQEFADSRKYCESSVQAVASITWLCRSGCVGWSQALNLATACSFSVSVLLVRLLPQCQHYPTLRTRYANWGSGWRWARWVWPMFVDLLHREVTLINWTVLGMCAMDYDDWGIP